ncbi:hypothetical protein KY290_034028 [Solanum tuberosum]|uniref:Uncharacterized protein n=1 Tax=Solanum tuberosum TaxID=4113 RepID=A0ABQ7U2I6_SOLTU|nr:hypothetical protein KY289_033409 [Solanum tuberosum]KAH0648045.1 hypothetical protein KY285_033293 [Solanum tuberosum]KAH0740985.1 hypothetical protein KY290_034028 [Solanum tuberosum]
MSPVGQNSSLEASSSKILGGSPIGTLDRPNRQKLNIFGTFRRANLAILQPIRRIANWASEFAYFFNPSMFQ